MACLASRRLGQTKGPFIVWVFFTLYFAILILFGRSLGGAFPQYVTVSVILGLLFGIAEGYGVLLVFLVVFLALWEKRRSLRQIFSGIGLGKTGSAKSVLWSFALFPLLIVIGSMLMVLSSFLGPIPFLSASVTNTMRYPSWYLYYMILHSFFPVAVVEEAFARGYMLDRLMPQHPSTLKNGLPAILLSSLLFTLWHLPGYLVGYRFSVPWVAGLLAFNVFPISVVLSIAYVRAGARNIFGPVLVHFLLDAMTPILMLVGIQM